MVKYIKCVCLFFRVIYLSWKIQSNIANFCQIAIFQDLSVTDDWVDEKDPALKIAYDISGQNFTLQGIPSKIGTSTPSKMFSFSAFGPGEGNKANAIGLKTLSNNASSNIGGAALLKA